MRIARAETLPPVQPPSDAVKPQSAPADLEEHFRLMCDLLVLAFQTDVTRVATCMFGREGSEGNGTLLDNCMIAYGSGNSDGNRHTHDNVPLLLVGKGGGTIKTGRHIRYPKETPLNNLWLAMLERMGVSTERLGDSTGVLEGLG
jgi:hypothetical protein